MIEWLVAVNQPFGCCIGDEGKRSANIGKKRVVYSKEIETKNIGLGEKYPQNRAQGPLAVVCGSIIAEKIVFSGSEQIRRSRCSFFNASC
jgi:hypothetical protein